VRSQRGHQFFRPGTDQFPLRSIRILSVSVYRKWAVFFTINTQLGNCMIISNTSPIQAIGLRAYTTSYRPTCNSDYWVVTLSRNVRPFLTIHECCLKLKLSLHMDVWDCEQQSYSTALYIHSDLKVPLTNMFVSGTFKSQLKTFLFCHAYMTTDTDGHDLPPALLKLQPCGSIEIWLLLLLLSLLL